MSTTIYERLFRVAALLPEQTIPLAAQILGRVTPEDKLESVAYSSQIARLTKWNKLGFGCASKSCSQLADEILCGELLGNHVDEATIAIYGFRL